MSLYMRLTPDMEQCNLQIEKYNTGALEVIVYSKVLLDNKNPVYFSDRHVQTVQT